MVVDHQGWKQPMAVNSLNWGVNSLNWGVNSLDWGANSLNWLLTA